MCKPSRLGFFLKSNTAIQKTIIQFCFFAIKLVDLMKKLRYTREVMKALIFEIF